MNLSAIVFEVAVSILAQKPGKQYVCRTTSKIVWLFSGTQPICCFPSSVKQNTAMPYVVPQARVLLKNTSLPTFPTTRLAPKNLDVPLTGSLILLGVLFTCTGLNVSAGSELMEWEALSHFSTWQGLKQHEISYVEVDDRDTGVELHYYRKRGPKNIGLQTDKRLMQKTQWPPPFWNSQGSFRISIGSHSFPVHAFPFLLSAFLRTRGTLSLATRANCILRTWNWAVGTSFLSPMQSESQSMDTRTTVSPTVVDFKESIPLW